MFQTSPPAVDPPVIHIKSVQITLLDKIHKEYEVQIQLDNFTGNILVVHMATNNKAFPVKDLVVRTPGIQSMTFTVNAANVDRKTAVHIFAQIKGQKKAWANVITLMPSTAATVGGLRN